MLYGHVKQKKNTKEDPELTKLCNKVILYLTKRGYRSIFQLLKLIYNLDPDRIGSFPIREL